MAQFTFVDLFAGIGGFHLALKENGGEFLAFSEIDRNAISTYCTNHNCSELKNLGDITKLKNLPSHDLLTAGVPCQSWSIAGKNLGFDDDRGQLWNDTIYLLNKSRPKAFIFENVKGLTDPRNKEALEYILSRIREAGYYAKPLILNSFDYGVVQNRVRVYIVGFREKKYLELFSTPQKVQHELKLYDVLTDFSVGHIEKKKFSSDDIFGGTVPVSRTRFQKEDEVNDFFLFNDIRNGHSTIHSWDIIETTALEKEVCYALMRNRRKKVYGKKDGNPLSLTHLRELVPEVDLALINSLISKEILKKVPFAFQVNEAKLEDINAKEQFFFEKIDASVFSLNDIAEHVRFYSTKKLNWKKVLEGLVDKNIVSIDEYRFDFKHSKISSGINGVNRIYLPNSDVFSTLVASDTNDFIATDYVTFSTPNEYKEKFIEQIFEKKKYRKVTKKEACKIQGFPVDFKLQSKRSIWMKLLGNSVSVPVIDRLVKSIIYTGVFK